MNRYESRGVSSSKKEVHAAIKNLDKGVFSNAFCKVLPDLNGNSTYCSIMHADGAGTKSSLAYLYWKETGDLSVWEGIAIDALVMNLDDMMATGCLGPFIVSSTIGRNKNKIPAEIIATIIQASQKFAELCQNFEVQLNMAGGETADLGDLVKTIIVDSTFYSREKRDNIINIDLKENDVIVAIASDGKSLYENSFNAGMGSNGLTSARHDLLHKTYFSKYPETFDSNIDEKLIYSGSYLVNDLLENSNINIGKAILSPTRTYAPLLKSVLLKHKKDISGIIHCTGGGQTKVLHFLNKPLNIIKDNLLPIPQLFQTIAKESGASFKEMMEVFNMGHRLEFYCPQEIALEIIDISESLKLEAKIIGRVEKSNQAQLNISHQGNSAQWLA